MIISHKRKFIFIKTRKTAGTSIEIALSKFCGNKDILTPISKHDELIREKLGYTGPQNYKGFHNHIPAVKVKRLINSSIWNNYFKFCFERNPFDKAVSLFYFEKRKKFKTISQMLENPRFTRKLNNFNLYSNTKNNIIIDKVYLYENLEESLEEIKNILGFDVNIRLPNAKTGYRKIKNYRDVLGDFEKEQIKETCKFEIDTFGYEF